MFGAIENLNGWIKVYPIKWNEPLEFSSVLTFSETAYIHEICLEHERAIFHPKITKYVIQNMLCYPKKKCIVVFIFFHDSKAHLPQIIRTAMW